MLYYNEDLANFKEQGRQITIALIFVEIIFISLDAFLCCYFLKMGQHYNFILRSAEQLKNPRKVNLLFIGLTIYTGWIIVH